MPALLTCRASNLAASCKCASLPSLPRLLLPPRAVRPCTPEWVATRQSGYASLQPSFSGCCQHGITDTAQTRSVCRGLWRARAVLSVRYDGISPHPQSHSHTNEGSSFGRNGIGLVLHHLLVVRSDTLCGHIKQAVARSSAHPRLTPSSTAGSSMCRLNQ